MEKTQPFLKRRKIRTAFVLMYDGVVVAMFSRIQHAIRAKSMLRPLNVKIRQIIKEEI